MRHKPIGRRGRRSKSSMSEAWQFIAVPPASAPWLPAMVASPLGPGAPYPASCRHGCTFSASFAIVT
jgi:hypothetical protein